MLRFLILICLFHLSLLARPIETFYGVLEVEEPVLLELIDSPAFIRLKKLRQYGVSYYFSQFREEYTRYDHSLGVFAILRLKGASLEEQIAGLLHDVSHTVFSHVGDWFFHVENQEKDFQNRTHIDFLQRYGLETILQKHGFEAANMLPDEKKFPRLEKPSPQLCADRIDYNIQGAYYRGSLTRAEGRGILDDLQYIDGDFVGSKKELLAKIVRFSLYMSKNCWGSVQNHLASTHLSDAMRRALEIKLICEEDIRFGTDQEVFEKLSSSHDSVIQNKLQELLEVDSREYLTPVFSKFRGINPLILLAGKKVPLTELDPILKEEYRSVKEEMSKGLVAIKSK